MRKINGFEQHMAGYKHRLRLFREVIAVRSQQDIADALGIDLKRWNNYERGYPIPREIAFLIREKFPGMSVEWLWWGDMGNLSSKYTRRLALAEKRLAERDTAQAELEKALKRVKQLKPKRKPKK